MIELLPDIFHTDSDRPFANEVETRAYLVTLATGNLLFYSSSQIGLEFDFIRSKGGIRKQYLNHRDEASEWCVQESGLTKTLEIQATVHRFGEGAFTGAALGDHIRPLFPRVPEEANSSWLFWRRTVP